MIADDIFKRLPSTTGSHPHNGRAEDAEGKAVRYKIRASGAEEMLDVYMAQHNATPHEGISWRTPIEFIRQFLESPEDHFLLRPLPQQARKDAYMFSLAHEVTVRGSLKNGRRPYIQ